jgi:hypothetical protein
LKAVAPNPERRHQSAAELAGALRQLMPRLQLPDVPSDVIAASPAGIGRTVALVAVILGLIVAWAWWFTR